MAEDIQTNGTVGEKSQKNAGVPLFGDREVYPSTVARANSPIPSYAWLISTCTGWLKEFKWGPLDGAQRSDAQMQMETR